MMRNWTRTAGVLAFTGLLAAGCIDESDKAVKAPAANDHPTAPAADSTAVPSTVNATLSEWTIALSGQSVPHGTVTFEIRNNGTEDHAFEVEGGGEEWKTEPIKPGESASLSIAMHAGTYNVYCPIATGGEAHADRGMRTSFEVK